MNSSILTGLFIFFALSSSSVLAQTLEEPTVLPTPMPTPSEKNIESVPSGEVEPQDVNLPNEVSPVLPVQNVSPDLAPILPLDEQKAQPYSLEGERSKKLETPALRFSGDGMFQFQGWQKPSSAQGHGAFEIPSLQVGVTAPLRSETLFKAVMQMAENRDATSGRHDVQMSEMSLSGRPVHWISGKVGLQDSSWNELWSRYSALNSLYFAGYPALKRMGYHMEDLGVKVETNEMLSEYFHLIFFYKNGEGRFSPETGSHKDLETMLMVGSPISEKGLQWSLAGMYQQGAYENINPSQNQRHRAMGFLGLQWPQIFRLSGQYFETQDAIDGLPAAGVGTPDLSSRAGQVAKGKGWQVQVALGLWFIEDLHPLELFVEGLSFDPDDQIETNSMSAMTSGVNCYWSEDLTFTLASLQKTFQSQYGLLNEDQQSVVFVIRALF